MIVGMEIPGRRAGMSLPGQGRINCKMDFGGKMFHH
jgi:hypothetical protein